MIGLREESAWASSDFYRQSYHKILNWLIVDAAIVSLLVLIIIYLILMQPAPSYYASTLAGDIFTLPV